MEVSLKQLGFVCLAVLIGLVLSWVLSMVLSRRARSANKESIRGAVVVAINGPLRWIIIVAALWISFVILATENAEGVISLGATGKEATLFYRLFFVSELPLVMWFGLRLTNGLTAIWQERASGTTGTFDDQLVPVTRTLSKLAILVVGLLLIVQNLGGQVGSLLAGLGIGGAAIALASKDTIANLFGSIVIFVDRPFQVGDWVEIGAHEGTIEAVGLRVTRIRTFANSLITVPNSTLTTTAINNWSRMRKRRLKLTLGVTYDANPAQIRAGVAAIREVLTDERVSQDFMLVNFTNFGSSSLDIFIYAFTLTTNWAEYMQTREDLLLTIMDRFTEIGLSFAFPTQSLHIESLPPGAPEAMQREVPL